METNQNQDHFPNTPSAELLVAQDLYRWAKEEHDWAVKTLTKIDKSTFDKTTERLVYECLKTTEEELLSTYQRMSHLEQLLSESLRISGNGAVNPNSKQGWKF